MEIVFTLDAQEDINYWKKIGNTTHLKKIKGLIESILKTPYEGIGKPEPLKHQLTGTWLRRIDREHRLVYKVSGDLITILSAKGHY